MATEKYLTIYEDGAISTNVDDIVRDIPLMLGKVNIKRTKVKMPVIYVLDENDTDPELIGEMLQAAGVKEFWLARPHELPAILHSRRKVLDAIKRGII